jgi:predicted Zn-dependent peptidase
MYKMTTLDNGLRIVTTQMPTMQSVSLGIWVGVGSRYEPAWLNGISHFVEHLVFKGTRKRDDHEITCAIEGVGGVLNASTSEEVTFYYCQVVKDKFAYAAEVFFDMFTGPIFEEKHMAPQKHIIIEEIHMYDDRPASMVQDLLNDMMWPGQPLGRKILGTEKTIMKMERKDLVDFYQRTYRTGNMVISVAGDIDHDEIVKEIKKHTRKIKTGSRLKHPAAKEQQRTPHLELISKETEQSHMSIGLRSFHRNHRDRYVLKVMSTLMGENMSSRLFREVREKHGLAYSIGTTVEPYLDTGAFVVSGGIITDRLEQAIKVILKELARLKTRKVPKAELERAREFILGLFKMSLDRTMTQMMWTGERVLLTGKLTEPEQIIKGIKAVSADDIMRVANRIFRPGRLNTAIVGPFDDAERFKKLIKV